jgi:hypothetical protein
MFSAAKTATPKGPQLGHKKHYEHGMDKFNQLSHQESMQKQPAWLENNMDTQNFGNTGQTGELHACFTDKRSVGIIFNGSMEDGADMWQRFNQGDFFQIDSGGTAEGSAQALDSSDIYHQIIDKQQHVRE